MFKGQKASKDIVKIVTSVDQPLCYEATRISFVRKAGVFLGF